VGADARAGIVISADADHKGLHPSLIVIPLDSSVGRIPARRDLITGR
jgi:hypothetical protein